MGTSNTNVQGDWKDAKLQFKDGAGNVIANFDGGNRKLEIPSGSLLDLSGATTVIKFAANTINTANIATNTIAAAQLREGIVNAASIATGVINSAHLITATTNNIGPARIGKWSYVFGTTGNAIGTNYNLAGAALPANAVVYHGIIATTSPFDAVGCGMSVGLVANADLLANTNVALSTAFNANGQSNTIPNIVNIGTAIKPTAARIPYVVFAGANANTGKFNLYLHYLVTD